MVDVLEDIDVWWFLKIEFLCEFVDVMMYLIRWLFELNFVKLFEKKICESKNFFILFNVNVILLISENSGWFIDVVLFLNNLGKKNCLESRNVILVNGIIEIVRLLKLRL